MKKTLTLRAEVPREFGAEPKPKVRVSPARLDTLHDTAREMRRNPTKAELALWDKLANAQLGGHKFKYKAVVGSAIVDFLVPTRKLAVEIDHEAATDPEVDERRKRKLAGLGLTVVRVHADDVLRNLDGVLRHIFDAIQAQRRPAR